MRYEELTIEGRNAVLEAFRAGKTIDKVFLMDGCQDGPIKSILREAKKTDAIIQFVTKERLDQLSDSQKHQGVIAFLPAITYQKLEDIIPFLYEQGKNPFIVLLDGVTDVRNFGAIARTCECAGVDAIVIPAKGSVTVNADAMKTSAGALHVLPVCKEKSITQAIKFLQESGVKVYAASEKAYENYTGVKYEGPVAIVMGAEDTGVSMDNLRMCDQMVKIPQFGTIGSLNVSVASSILVYEVVRQRMDEQK